MLSIHIPPFYSRVYYLFQKIYIMNIKKILSFLSSAMILGSALYISQFPQPLLHPIKLVTALAIMFFAYIGILWSKPKNLWLILGTSITAQFLFLSMPAFFNDFYRYLWDGSMLSNGISPYALTPWNVFDSPALKHLTDVWYWDTLYFKWSNTIYPPTLQLFFASASLLKTNSTLVLKSIFFVFNIGTLGLALKLLDTLKKPRYLIALIALNPLFLFETMAAGHFEPVLLFFLLLTLYLLHKNKSLLSGLSFGALILTKYFPILLAPLFMVKKNYRWWVTALVTLATIALLYLPFLLLTPNPSDLFESLKTFQAEWVMTPGLFALISWATSYSSAKLISLVLTLSATAFVIVSYKKHQDIFKASWQIFFSLLVLSSVIFSWYVLWLVVLLPFISNRLSTIALSGTILLQYLVITYSSQEGTFIYLQNGEILWLQLSIWIPPLIAIMYEHLKKKRTLLLRSS